LSARPPQSEFVPVAVIIPCFNSAETVARSVHSVLSQTVLPKQLILVDDASDDSGRTLDVLYELEREAKLTIPIVDVIPLAINGGAAVARNSGWEKATQDYIAFLDADDSWHRDKLRVQFGWMAQHPSAAMTGHQTQVMEKGQETPAIKDDFFVREVSAQMILLRNLFPTRTVMMRRNVPFRFECEMRRLEDYHLWLRVILDGFSAWRIELPLAFSYKADYGAGGLSAALWKMEKGELDAYWRLYQLGKFSFFVLLGLCVWSLVKFARRVVVYMSPAKQSK